VSTRRIALLLEYEGTSYRGSQLQKGVPTVQGALEEALFRLTEERTRVAMAGRTDAGVHARGQVASFRTEKPLPLRAFVEGLNYYLPEDIAVVAAAEVPLSFDVRRQARRRWYRYLILLRPARSPLLRRFAWHLPERLDLEAMARAAPLLEGEHDFAAFTMPAMKGRAVRHVFRCRFRWRGDLAFLDMEANAFLPQQVRRTVGALVEVGRGRLSPQALAQMLQQPRPGAASLAAPPHGLCLMRVYYDKEIFGHGS